MALAAASGSILKIGEEVEAKFPSQSDTGCWDTGRIVSIDDDGGDAVYGVRWDDENYPDVVKLAEQHVRRLLTVRRRKKMVWKYAIAQWGNKQ